MGRNVSVVGALRRLGTRLHIAFFVLGDVAIVSALGILTILVVSGRVLVLGYVSVVGGRSLATCYEVAFVAGVQGLLFLCKNNPFLSIYVFIHCIFVCQSLTSKLKKVLKT